MSKQTRAQAFAEELHIVVLVHSAIAGTSTAATLALITRGSLEGSLLVALGCFATAIPFSIGLVLLTQVIYGARNPTGFNVERTSQIWPTWSYLLAVADQLACFGGFLILFWHLHWAIGVLFLSASALAWITAWRAEKNLRDENR